MDRLRRGQFIRRMLAALDILKVPAVNGAVVAATTFIDGMTDVLSVMLLLATLIWTIVKIANALKEFHDED